MTILQFRASRTATQAHQLSGSSHDRAGLPINPHSNRDLLEGFSRLIRLQADSYLRSVVFALICMLVPTVIAVTASAYVVLAKPHDQALSVKTELRPS